MGHDDQTNEEERAGQVLLLKGGMYWDSPVRLCLKIMEEDKNLSGRNHVFGAVSSAAAL